MYLFLFLVRVLQIFESAFYKFWVRVLQILSPRFTNFESAFYKFWVRVLQVRVLLVQSSPVQSAKYSMPYFYTKRSNFETHLSKSFLLVQIQNLELLSF